MRLARAYLLPQHQWAQWRRFPIQWRPDRSPCTTLPAARHSLAALYCVGEGSYHSWTMSQLILLHQRIGAVAWAMPSAAEPGDRLRVGAWGRWGLAFHPLHNTMRKPRGLCACARGKRVRLRVRVRACLRAFACVGDVVVVYSSTAACVLTMFLNVTFSMRKRECFPAAAFLPPGLLP